MCIYIYICVYIYTCVNVHICIYTYMCIYSHIYIYLDLYVFTYKYIHIYTCIHIQLYTYIYIYTFLHIYLHTYIYTHVHTHVHTHIGPTQAAIALPTHLRMCAPSSRYKQICLRFFNGFYTCKAQGNAMDCYFYIMYSTAECQFWWKNILQHVSYWAFAYLGTLKSIELIYICIYKHTSTHPHQGR